MIQNNLSVVMAKKRFHSLTELSDQTGLSRTTLTAMYYEKGKGIQFETLDILCNFFGVDVGELLTHVNEAS